MQIEIDPTSEVPLYQQLHDQVVEGIASGGLRTGDALASVRQLALAFGINAATVAKGYELLRQEGLVRTSRRSGSVVARDPGDEPDGPAFLDGWSARARAVVAEAVAHGIPDDRIAALVTEQLQHFNVARAAADGSAGPTAGIDPEELR